MSWTDDDIEKLRTLREAFDSMKIKRLARGAFTRGNDRCAIRVFSDYVAPEFKPTSMDTLMADGLGTSKLFLSTVIFENDIRFELCETPEQRWQRMRDWVDEQLAESAC